ncbi:MULTISPECIES: hypothetical protein [unclassified Bosea (in: a-proteobacteria)]|uniref:hypothetical protein n=1 Tax=unclassified Bosea (in: a-proteobacteria) TaxID=2653178 RepID=UPI000F752F05|nr:MULTISPECIES: hypothetical protein [unclassified Bosea (in: a-proteobacteria)]AZO79333.1 hypothetical protein BLM15_18265 [Bosea sp. Tri-49]RXT27254.1 hypothetical protein B5U98_00090 [Bosea sp. Tri-39]RXT36040.1 hypothetical protein B5U99_17910 [Bosea sp. Tri-54]
MTDLADTDRKNRALIERASPRPPERRTRREAKLTAADLSVQIALAETAAPTAYAPPDLALEAIVSEDGPLIFAKHDRVDLEQLPARGPKAQDLFVELNDVGRNLREIPHAGD